MDVLDDSDEADEEMLDGVDSGLRTRSSGEWTFAYDDRRDGAALDMLALCWCAGAP